MTSTTEQTLIARPIATRPSWGEIAQAPISFLVRLNQAYRQFKHFQAQEAERYDDMGITAAEAAKMNVWDFFAPRSR